MWNRLWDEKEMKGHWWSWGFSIKETVGENRGSIDERFQEVSLIISFYRLWYKVIRCSCVSLSTWFTKKLDSKEKITIMTHGSSKSPTSQVTRTRGNHWYPYNSFWPSHMHTFSFYIHCHIDICEHTHSCIFLLFIYFYVHIHTLYCIHLILEVICKRRMYVCERARMNYGLYSSPYSVPMCIVQYIVVSFS